MKGNWVVGMIAGSVVGVAAAMVAMPYFQPQINRVVRRGRTVIDKAMDKMESGS